MNQRAEDRALEALAQTLRGDLSPEVGLMQLIIATESVERVQQIVRGATGGTAGTEASRLKRLSRLLAENTEGCARIAAMLRSNIDTDEAAPSVAEGIAFCTRLFDWSVQQQEQPSVALYSLGNPTILGAATQEVVSVLEGMGVLGQERSVLDIGCGIGRIEAAVSDRVREIVGIDLSQKMIAVARRRCAKLLNVRLMQTDGCDLSLFPDARFDLVLAVDSFPYLVQSGMALVERHFLEARRVLQANGDLVICGFSYGNDPARDSSLIARLAHEIGFDLVAAGVRPFTLWDASLYHLRPTAAEA